MITTINWVSQNWSYILNSTLPSKCGQKWTNIMIDILSDRQTLAEFNPEMRIYLVRLDGAVQVSDLNTLLPEAFSPKKLSFKFHNGNC